MALQVLANHSQGWGNVAAVDVVAPAGNLEAVGAQRLQVALERDRVELGDQFGGVSADTRRVPKAGDQLRFPVATYGSRTSDIKS